MSATWAAARLPARNPPAPSCQSQTAATVVGAGLVEAAEAAAGRVEATLAQARPASPAPGRLPLCRRTQQRRTTRQCKGRGTRHSPPTPGCGVAYLPAPRSFSPVSFTPAATYPAGCGSERTDRKPRRKHRSMSRRGLRVCFPVGERWCPTDVEQRRPEPVSRLLWDLAVRGPRKPCIDRTSRNRRKRTETGRTVHGSLMTQGHQFARA